jgi:DNA mismatch repair protein MutS
MAGGSEHSFGIHVAKMAGMPANVVLRANEILKKLENAHVNAGTKIKTADDYQLSFFQLNDPVLEQIKEQIEKTDINTLTPVEALMKLNEIKKLLGE